MIADRGTDGNLQQSPEIADLAHGFRVMQAKNIVSNWVVQLPQLARFVVVGALNTGLSYGVFLISLRLGALFWLANLIGLVFGIFISFVMQGSLVFFNRDRRRFVRFVLMWLSIYTIQTWCIGLIIARGYAPSVAGFIVLPGTAVVSYLAQKYFVFRVFKPAAQAGSTGTGA